MASEFLVLNFARKIAPILSSKNYCMAASIAHIKETCIVCSELVVPDKPQLEPIDSSQFHEIFREFWFLLSKGEIRSRR